MTLQTNITDNSLTGPGAYDHATQHNEVNQSVINLQSNSLVTTNNLSDVTSTSAALANLGGLPIIDSPTVVASSGAAVTILEPASNPRITYVTLTAATVTFTFPSAAAGKFFRVYFLQDGSGSRKVAVPGNVVGMPVLNIQPNGISCVRFECVDGVNFIASGVDAIDNIWTSYTPTVTVISGLTLGNGTTQGRYAVNGKLLIIQHSFVKGSTTAYSTTFCKYSIPLPTNPSTGAAYVAANGSTDYYGLSFYDQVPFLTGTTNPFACAVQRNTSTVTVLGANTVADGAGTHTGSVLSLNIVVEVQ